MEAGDEDFIYHAWLNALWHGKYNSQSIPQSLFYASYRKRINRILANSDVRIACLLDDPAIILSFVVYQRQHDELTPIVHWIYTKHDFRNHSIATDLLRNIGIEKGSEVIVTAFNWRVSKNKSYRVIHNPFLLDRGE